MACPLTLASPAISEIVSLTLQSPASFITARSLTSNGLLTMQELERSIISMLVKQLITPLAAILEDQLRARAAAVCLPGTVQAQS